MSVQGKISDYYLPCPALTYNCGHKLPLGKSNGVRLSGGARRKIHSTIYARRQLQAHVRRRAVGWGSGPESQRLVRRVDAHGAAFEGRSQLGARCAQDLAGG